MVTFLGFAVLEETMVVAESRILLYAALFESTVNLAVTNNMQNNMQIY